MILNMKAAARSFVIVVGCWLFFAVFPLANARAQNEPVNDAISMNWSPDGELIATGYKNGSISISDSLSGKTIRMLIAHSSAVLNVAWSPDSRQLASASVDKTLRIWNTFDGTLSETLSIPSDDQYSVIWSLDGEHIITGGIENSHNLNLWDAKTGSLLQAFKAGSSVQMKWSPDGKVLALANPSGGIEFRNAKTLELIKFIDDPEMGGQGFDNYQIAWKADSMQITAGKLNGMLRTWDVSTERILSTFNPNDSNEIGFTTTLITSVRYINDDTELVSVSADGTLRIWDVISGQIEQTVPLGGLAYAAAFSPEGSKIAFASTSAGINFLSLPVT
jgi:WD40 repeat protein